MAAAVAAVLCHDPEITHAQQLTIINALDEGSHCFVFVSHREKNLARGHIRCSPALLDPYKEKLCPKV